MIKIELTKEEAELLQEQLSSIETWYDNDLDKLLNKIEPQIERQLKPSEGSARVFLGYYQQEIHGFGSKLTWHPNSALLLTEDEQWEHNLKICPDAERMRVLPPIGNMTFL